MHAVDNKNAVQAIQLAKSLLNRGMVDKILLRSIEGDRSTFVALAELARTGLGEGDDGLEAVMALSVFARRSAYADDVYRHSFLKGLREEMYAALRNPPASNQTAIKAQDFFLAMPFLPSRETDDLPVEAKALGLAALADIRQKGADSPYAGMERQVFILLSAWVGDPEVCEGMRAFIRSGGYFEGEEISFFATCPQAAGILLAVAGNGEPFKYGGKDNTVNLFNHKVYFCVRDLFFGEKGRASIPYFAAGMKGLCENEMIFAEKVYLTLSKNRFLEGEQELLPIVEAAAEEYERQCLDGKEEQAEPLLSIVKHYRGPLSSRLREHLTRRLQDNQASYKEQLVILKTLWLYPSSDLSSEVLEFVLKTIQSPDPIPARLRYEAHAALICYLRGLSRSGKEIEDRFYEAQAQSLRALLAHPQEYSALLHRDFVGAMLRETGALAPLHPAIRAAIQQLSEQADTPADLREWFREQLRK